LRPQDQKEENMNKRTLATIELEEAPRKKQLLAEATPSEKRLPAKASYTILNVFSAFLIRPGKR
jgi:hypothetical protein